MKANCRKTAKSCKNMQNNLCLSGRRQASLPPAPPASLPTGQACLNHLLQITLAVQSIPGILEKWTEMTFGNSLFRIPSYFSDFP